MALLGVVILLRVRREKVPSWHTNFGYTLGAISIIGGAVAVAFLPQVLLSPTLFVSVISLAIIGAFLACVPFISGDEAKKIATKAIEDQHSAIHINFNDVKADAINWTWVVTGQSDSGSGWTPFEKKVHTKWGNVLS